MAKFASSPGLGTLCRWPSRGLHVSGADEMSPDLQQNVGPPPLALEHDL